MTTIAIPWDICGRSEHIGKIAKQFLPHFSLKTARRVFASKRQCNCLNGSKEEGGSGKAAGFGARGKAFPRIIIIV
jgi:hypothetical protein